MASAGDTLQCGFYFLYVYILTLQIHKHSCTVFTSNGTLALDTGNRSRGTTSQDGVLRFGGQEDEADYFQLLHWEGEHLLLGAKNVVYNLSAHTLQEQERISWSADVTAGLTCRAKQKSSEECQNYIKMIMKTEQHKLMICGTNAFKPRCRHYRHQTDGTYFHLASEDEDGYGRVPYDPTHNSSAVMAGERLYTATMTGWQGSHDALIYSPAPVPVMTAPKHSEVLNGPSFVGTADYADKVFFFFREVAVEHINCGKAVFSRVAQVCKNDEGGHGRVLKDTFTSFFKARLNCSLPGEYPFYFDEIQSTSEMGRGNYMSSLFSGNRTDMVYAVFNTPQNGISGSAVCAYRFSDIQRSFEGPFKDKQTPTSIWLPVNEEQVPSPHPAKSCSNDSKLLSDSTLNFIAQHPLMDEAVPAFGGQPILVDTNTRYRMTQVTVHWQVRAADGRYYDVLFIGTDNGRVLKAVNKAHAGVHTVVVEDLELFSDHAPVVSLKLVLEGDTRQLVVVSRNEVKALPLHRCHLKTTCSACVALQDPYCMWYDKRCTNHAGGIQSIETGSHQHCSPDNHSPHDTTVAPSPPAAAAAACPPCLGCPLPTPATAEARKSLSYPEDVRPTRATPQRGNPEPCYAASSSELGYSKQTLVLSILLTMILSLLAGCAGGYFLQHRSLQRLLQRCRRRSSHDNDAVPDHKQLSFSGDSKGGGGSGVPDNRWDKPPPSVSVSNNLNTPHNANIYQSALLPPAPPADTGFMTAGRLPEKQLNIVANALRAPSSGQANGSVDTKLMPPKGKTYL